MHICPLNTYEYIILKTFLYFFIFKGLVLILMFSLMRITVA